MSEFLHLHDLEDVVLQIRAGRAVLVSQRIPEGPIETELLSAEEQQRAASFSPSEARSAFVCGRVLLRRLLGEFVTKVEFRIGPHGKPTCDHPDAPAFNLSHTGDHILAGFAPRGPLGVDLEIRDRLIINPVGLGKRVFSKKEQEDLAAGRIDFLTCWTRKEAVLKALGGGFSAGAAQIDADSMAASSGWRLYSFEHENLVGSVCVAKEFELVFCVL